MKVFIPGTRDAPKEVGKGLIWGKSHHLEMKKGQLEKRTVRAR